MIGTRSAAIEIRQRRAEVGEVEGEPLVEQPPGDDVPAVEGQVGVRAEDQGRAEADHPREGGEPERASPAGIASAHDETGAEDDAALVGAFRRRERLFPRTTDKGGEPLAERRRLVAADLGRVAVEVGGGHLDPDGRRVRDGSAGFAQHAGRLDAGTQDLVAVVGGLDAIDGAAHEIDEAGGTIEARGPRAEGACVPGDVVEPGGGSA